MTDTQRAAFEAWWLSDVPEEHRAFAKKLLDGYGPEYTSAAGVADAWETWQAAQAALSGAAQEEPADAWIWCDTIYAEHCHESDDAAIEEGWEPLYRGHREAIPLESLSKLLPGSYYMDPPDGGCVYIMEQLRRMADDARQWREHIAAPAAPAAPSALEVEITPIVMVGSPNACQVWLNRGAQQFAVGSPHETREDGEWFADMLRKAIAPAAPDVAPEQSQSMSRHSRAMLLNVLWHHQGGSSQVGQPIRRLLGIKPHARLNDEELAEAKWIDGLLAAPAQAEQQGDGGIRDALAGMLKWFGKYPEFIPDWPAQADKVKAAIENANAALSSTERPSARVAKCSRCGSSTAQACNEMNCGRMEAGEQPSARVSLSDEQIVEIADRVEAETGAGVTGDAHVIAFARAILAASAAQGGGNG